MASFNDCLTVDGQRIFALMAKGNKVTFTKVVLGDGIKDNSVSEVDIRSVINPVVELNIDSVTMSEDNKVTISTAFQNTQSAPFFMREKGVYATVDGTEEYLVFYANNGTLAEYVDVAKTQLIEKTIQTVIMFSESDNINITLSSNEVVEMVSDLEKRLTSHVENESNPHKVDAEQVGLGNVPNVSTNNQTPTYTVASANAELSSGEKLSVAMGKIAKAISSLISHLSNESNPHKVDAEQIGLGNVPNVSTNNQTPTYTVASANAALSSGEKLSVAMGKIAKAISSLISHLSNESNPHKVTAEQIGAIDTLITMEEVNASTDLKKPVGAGAFKELNSNLGGLRFGVDGDGNYGYYGADDSLIPFKSGGDNIILASNGVYSYTFDKDYEKVYVFVTNGHPQNYAGSPSKPTCTSSEISIREIANLIYATNYNAIVLYELSDIKSGQSVSFTYDKHMIMIDGIGLDFELITSNINNVNITTDKDYKFVVAVTSLSSVQHSIYSIFSATNPSGNEIIVRNLAHYNTGNANLTSIKMVTDLERGSVISIANSGNGSYSGTDARYANIIIGLY